MQHVPCSILAPASNRIKLSLKRYWKLGTCKKLQVTFPTPNSEYTDRYIDREYPLMKSTVRRSTYVDVVASWFLKSRGAWIVAPLVGKCCGVYVHWMSICIYGKWVEFRIEFGYDRLNLHCKVWLNASSILNQVDSIADCQYCQ